MRTLAPLSAALLVALAACTSGSGGPGGRAGARRQMGSDSLPIATGPNATAHADLRDVNGNAVGTINLTQTPRGVLLTGDVTGLPAGIHAIHVHDTGRCEPPFTSAGGHVNPMMRTHGFKSPTGNHAGDLPNFSVAAGGTGHVEAIARDLTLAPGMVLFDGDGASVVVHAGADDYHSDPAGNSGNRIACGVITR